MKISVVCGNGLGTSLMMEVALKGIIKDLGVDATVEHMDLGSVAGSSSDIYVGTRDISTQIQSQGVKGIIVSLDNMVDKVAMKERLSEALKQLGAL